jgi:flagellar hook-associated protein 3 FlgL
VSQSKSVNSLYAANQGYANDALKLVDSKLDAANDIVTYVRTRAVESGNGTYSSREQAAIGADITQQFNALLGIANSQDSTGDFVFGGYRSNAMPFAAAWRPASSTRATRGPHAADLGLPQPADHQLRRGDLQHHPRRPARPLRSAPPATPVGPGLGLSLSGYNDHNYVVEVGAGPSYQVFDTTTDPNRASPIAPTVTTSGSDTTLAFGSVSLSLSGTPAAGDEFSVAKVASTFDVLGNFVTALNSGNPAATRFGGNQAIAGMDAAQESISRVRSASARGWSRWKPSRTSTAAWTCSTRKPCRACRTWITPKR